MVTQSIAQKFLANIRVILGGRLIVTALSLGTMWLTARFLPIDERGLFVTLVVWATVLASVGSLSIGKAAFKRSGQSQALDKGWLPGCLGAALTFNGLGAIPVVIIALVVLPGKATGGTSNLELSLSILLITSLMLSTAKSEILLACGQVRARSLSIVCGGVSCLVFTLLFVVVLRFGVAGALSARALGAIVAGSISLRVLWSEAGGRATFGLQELRGWLHDALKIHPNAVGNLVRARVDVIMLAYFVEKAEVSIYELAMRFVDLILMIPNTASASLLGQLSENNIDDLWGAQKRIIGVVMALVVAVVAVTYLIVPYFLTLAFGPSYALSGVYFQLLAPIVVGKTFGGLMSSQILGRGLLVQASIIGIGTTALNVFLNYKLIPIYGTKGAIYATLVAYGLMPIIFNTYYWFKINRMCKLEVKFMG